MHGWACFVTFLPLSWKTMPGLATGPRGKMRAMWCRAKYLAQDSHDQSMSSQIPDSWGSPSKAAELPSSCYAMDPINFDKLFKFLFTVFNFTWLLCQVEEFRGVLFNYKIFQLFSVIDFKFNSIMLWNHSLYNFYSFKFVEVCYRARMWYLLVNAPCEL